MVQGVEAPEEQFFMGNAVRPVESQFGNHHCQRHLNHHRPIRGPQSKLQRGKRLQDVGGIHGEDGGDQACQLQQPLRRQRMSDIVHRLAIRQQPASLVGDVAFEKEEEEDRGGIDRREGDHRVGACEGKMRTQQSREEHQRPGQISQSKL
ncbi:hypothetical protein D9M72_601430 [compost metagenome]